MLNESITDSSLTANNLSNTLNVKITSLSDTTLSEPHKVAARLCGGTSTCIALAEVDHSS